ncbi:major facilitator superfamily protein [Candidatus Omnitrophus magneticus]|uniref:Major facilitator superfamily protein n=1 Tax=Candidatus Omnitrophus magneticus TaxID=1609969 RepID=A0A0F0CNQ8_9BACT|nr:major facilitator superfamily protein [Candidatus Omnitrophus magneticus]
MNFSPFVLLCATGIFAIFSSTIAKSPVLPFFASSLGIGSSGIGVVAAVSSLVGIIVSIPAGILADRFGRKKMLMISAIVFATAPMLYLMVSNLWQLIIVRFYHGMATAIFMPVSMAMISDMFHKERGEKIGWFSTSTLMGRFAAPLVGASVIGLMAYSPILSYRVIYMICTIGGVIALIIVWRLPGDLEHGINDVAPWIDVFEKFKKLLLVKGVLITSVVEGAVLFAYGGFETFLPLYAVNIGFTPYEIGILLSTQIISVALTKPFMGRFSDKHGRPPQIFTGLILGGASMFGFFMFRGFVMFLLLSILFGLSISVVAAATSALIADLSKKESLASAMGILASVMDMGHTTGPLVAGVIASYYSYSMIFVLASFVLLFVSIAFLLSIKNMKAVNTTVWRIAKKR